MDIERKDDLPRPCVVHWTSDFGQFSRQRREQVSLTEVEVTVVNEVEEEEPSPGITTENDRSGGGLGYWPAWQNETTLSTNGWR